MKLETSGSAQHGTGR